MAVVVAQANGNWSDPATWAGGAVPGAGDTAQTGNYIVTIDASVTCTLNPTGSGYFLVTSGGITITGDLVMSSSYTGGGLRCTHSSGTVALTGTATGGAGFYTYGAANVGAGTMTIGTATGGAGSYSYGAYNTGAGGTMTVGTATGGAGDSAHGAANTGVGTMTVSTATGGTSFYTYGAANTGAGTMTIGTATGGAGSYCHGAANTGAGGTMTVSTATGGAGNYSYGAANVGAGGTMTVDLAVGNSYGPGGSHSLPGPGAYGGNGIASVSRVKRTQSGPYGQAAIDGAVLLADDIANSAQFRKIHNGATKTLTDAAATADFPAVTDVRHGVEYNYTDLVGTCAVPAPQNVAYGVPVDNTTGTAVLTAAGVTAAVWDAARSGHAGAGTFGATDEWAGSVDEEAIATAAAAAILAAADATPIKAALAADQGAVTFGQVKILADINYEGALHIDNNAPNGVGLFAHGTLIGQHNQGDQAGQYNYGVIGSGQKNLGVTGQTNEGTNGQINQGTNAGQFNTSSSVGQWNFGPTPVVGAAQQEIADALKRAPAAGTPAAGSVYDLLGDGVGALEATAQAVLAVIGAGSGTGLYTDTITNGSAPLDGVRVQLSTDAAGENRVYEAFTDALGVFVLRPDPGTYYRWLDLAGYTFEQGVLVEVEAL